MGPHLNIGVVGWGEIGRKHASCFAFAGARLAGVVSARKDLSLDVPVFSSFAEMMPHIDAATIAVPNYLHAPLCLQAIEAGIPVMVEKPICINQDELALLESAASQLKAPVHVGYRLRFNPECQRIKELIGTPKRIICRYQMGIDRLANGKEWTRSLKSTGGSFFTLGIHMLDLCRWLADARDQPLRILAASATHVDSSADYPLKVSVSGVLADGTELESNTDLRGNQGSQIEVVVEYSTSDVGCKSVRYTISTMEEDIEYRALISAFADAARTNTIDPLYLPEVLVTHRDLIASRKLSE
jgi:predicted dehydrogenase